MISSKIHMEYLQPESWTNLGLILSYLNPEIQVLHILMSETGKLKGVTSDHKKVEIEEFILNNQLDIQGIFLRYKTIEEVRVYTLQGLANYYKKVQDPSNYQMDIDDYLIYMYELQENTDGIEIYTRSNKTRCYMEYLRLLKKQFEKGGAFLLWLTKDGKLFFNCILEFDLGKLVKLTTSDRYREAYEDYDQVCARLQMEYPIGFKCVIMEIEEFRLKMAELYHTHNAY